MLYHQANSNLHDLVGLYWEPPARLSNAFAKSSAGFSTVNQPIAINAVPEQHPFPTHKLVHELHFLPTKARGAMHAWSIPVLQQKSRASWQSVKSSGYCFDQQPDTQHARSQL
jgi:hypothetical protein